MTHRERIVLVCTLVIIAAAVAIDLVTDSREGAASWHLLTEASAGAFAVFGMFYLLRGGYSLKRNLAEEQQLSTKLKQEAAEWRSRSQRYLQGLSRSIEEQLSKWRLTPAEKEVAFLLLKGLSLKEIAEIRMTTEKTARAQSMAVYSKAGLSGRSELAAFFLEDLLLPPSPTSGDNATDTAALPD